MRSDRRTDMTSLSLSAISMLKLLRKCSKIRVSGVYRYLQQCFLQVFQGRTGNCTQITYHMTSAWRVRLIYKSDITQETASRHQNSVKGFSPSVTRQTTVATCQFMPYVRTLAEKYFSINMCDLLFIIIIIIIITFTQCIYNYTPDRHKPRPYAIQCYSYPVVTI